MPFHLFIDVSWLELMDDDDMDPYDRDYIPNWKNAFNGEDWKAVISALKDKGEVDKFFFFFVRISFLCCSI
jgi:hypothetical protein